MRKILLPISLAAALTVSACSTNYGVYSKTDPRNDEFGYLSTYIALAAGILLVGALDDDDNGGSSGGGGGGY
ncbi:MAG: hypothetical protein ACON4V_09105 [Parvibaculales bacterium]